MEYVRELPTKYAKELRHTLVRWIDDKYYAIYTIQLYNFLLEDGRANFDTVVQETDENGDFNILRQQYNRRYHTREEALKHHDRILAEFDKLLRLQPSKRHQASAKAAEGATAPPPAAAAAPAASPAAEKKA